MRAISLLFGLLLSSATMLASDFSSYAFVNDDSTLRIGSQTVRLYGIIVPAFDQACASTVHPVDCGPRDAALALKSRVGSNFVHCNIQERKPDGSVLAICTANDQDLAAWLIQQGWAAASPGAPPEYAVLEKIARQRGVGMWALPPGSWPGR